MSRLGTMLPTRRPDLVLKPIGDDGRHVVKDVRAGAFFDLGPAESFLLLALDGRQTPDDICATYEARFGEPLTSEDLDDFLDLARAQGLLQPGDVPDWEALGEAEAIRDMVRGARQAGPSLEEPVPGGAAAPPSRPRPNLLYWRTTIFDPDGLFNWLEPRLRFVWTRGFLAASAAVIVASAWLVWAERQALVTQFPHAMRWQTLALAWLTMVAVTTCHEFAHGLTCKHYGGEVREVGFLLMYGLPCFYCNVSDAWLLPEKAKRLWVTLAGGYCDLVLWAAAVLVWRITTADSLVNYVAWVALSVCGVRIFFNFNPLLKLDGYYLVSDWLEVPNLRQRAWDTWTEHVRWLLWGAPRPGQRSRGRLLLGFGLASWTYSLLLMAAVLLGLQGALAGRGGFLGIGWMTVLGVAMVRGQFQGFTNGEFAKMLQARRRRAVGWAMALTALLMVVVTVRIEERVGGAFQVRPARRAEVRAPITGFLRAVEYAEGERVSPGAVVARLDVPDLASRIAQKRAEVQEAQAKLRLLTVGPRPEEVAEHRARVARAEAWRDLGRRDLEQARRSLRQELAELDGAFTQARLEHDRAAENYARSKKLGGRGALSTEQLRETESLWRIAETRLGQAAARMRAREASGTLEAEAELALREQKLAEARGALALLEAGSRPEEVDAERARLLRLREEARHLEQLRERVDVTSPVGGLVATPRLREKVGQYLREGDLICEVEAPDAFEVEITLAEQDGARVHPGQRVDLKARAIPYETFHARVERLAPRASKAEKTEVQASRTVYCRLDGRETGLCPGMTGHARIVCGWSTIGEILVNSILRVVRTEFWW